MRMSNQDPTSQRHEPARKPCQVRARPCTDVPEPRRDSQMRRQRLPEHLKKIYELSDRETITLKEYDLVSCTVSPRP